MQIALRSGAVFGILVKISNETITSTKEDLTFHWPGDRCPTVDISNALIRIFFLWRPSVASLLGVPSVIASVILEESTFDPKCSVRSLEINPLVCVTLERSTKQL